MLYGHFRSPRVACLFIMKNLFVLVNEEESVDEAFALPPTLDSREEAGKGVVNDDDNDDDDFLPPNFSFFFRLFTTGSKH